MPVFDEPDKPTHPRKLQGRPAPEHIRRCNAAKSKAQPRVSRHVVDDQQNKMGGLFTRAIGLNRLQTSIALA